MDWMTRAEQIAQIAAALAAISLIAVTLRNVFKRIWHTVLLLQRLGALIDTLQEFVEQTPVRELRSHLERIEHQLHALDQKHRYIFDVLADCGVFECDASGRCIYVSSRWCEMTGAQQHDALHNGWLIAVHSEDRQRVRQEWDDAIREHRYFDMSMRFLHRVERRIVYVYVRALPVLNPTGVLMSYIGFVRINGGYYDSHATTDTDD